MKPLTELFYNYFSEKVDAGDFNSAYYELQKLVTIGSNKNKEQYVLFDEETFKSFVKYYFTMKGNVDKRYNSILDYSNSLEGKSRPLPRKMISKNAMRDLEKLFPKFEKFEEEFADRTSFSLVANYHYFREKENTTTNTITRV